MPLPPLKRWRGADLRPAPASGVEPQHLARPLRPVEPVHVAAADDVEDPGATGLDQLHQGLREVSGERRVPPQERGHLHRFPLLVRPVESHEEVGRGRRGIPTEDVHRPHDHVTRHVALDPLLGRQLEPAVVIQGVLRVLLPVRPARAIEDVVGREEDQCGPALRAVPGDRAGGFQVERRRGRGVRLAEVHSTRQIRGMEDDPGVEFLEDPGDPRRIGHVQRPQAGARTLVEGAGPRATAGAEQAADPRARQAVGADDEPRGPGRGTVRALTRAARGLRRRHRAAPDGAARWVIARVACSGPNAANPR